MYRSWLRALPLCTCLIASPTQGSIAFTESFSSFLGTGITPATPGTLDSSRWRVSGFSVGDSVFGGIHMGGDLGRGASSGGVTTGGIYAFDVSGLAGIVDTALGFQATAADFTPGILELRLPPMALPRRSALFLAFDLVVRNDGARATQVGLSLIDPSGFTLLSEPFLYHTPAAAAGPSWRTVRVARTLPLERSLPGSLIVRWAFDDDGGRGSRDEIALDNIAAEVNPLASPVAEPRTLTMVLLGVLAVLAARRRRRRRDLARR